jgi:hypothetical protein
MSDQVIDSFMVPTGAPEEETPDPALFWRWVGGSTRPLIGWVLAAVGVIVIIVGWYGVSGQAVIAKQLPYLISGGLGGVALVGIGAALIGTERLRQDARRIARLEGMVQELYSVLLVHGDSPGEPDAAPTRRPAPDTAAFEVSAGAESNHRPVAIPTGSTYHDPDCAMVRGKSGVATVDRSTVSRRDLTACRICQPAPPAT